MGWVGAWGFWAGPGLVWMGCVVFVEVLLWGGCLQSVIVGEVGRCVGVRWWAGGGVRALRTGPVAAGMRVYSSVSHL